MTALNIEALMGMLRPAALPGTTPTPQQATGEADGLFLNLLQSFAETLGNGEAETAAPTGQPAGDWLATLFQLLAPAGTPNTLPGMPDPNSGEATDGEATLSLTEMMAAIQTLTGQAQPDTSASALAQVMQAIAGDTPDVGAALLESIQSSDAEGKKLHNALSTLMQELGMGANPALMAAMLNVQPKSGSSATPTAAETPAATGNAALPAATTTLTSTTPMALPAAPAAGQTADTPGAPVAPVNGNTPAAEAQNAAASSTGTPAFTVTTSATDAARTAPPATAESAQTGQPAPANPPAQTAQVPSSPFQQTLAAQTGQQTASQLAATPSTQTTEAAQARATENAPTPQTTDAPAPAMNVAQPTIVAPTQPAAVPVADAPPAPTLPDIPALKQLVDTISVLKQNGQTAVRMRLHPASLGQVMVQLQVNDGNVTVQVLAETSKAQALIQNNLPALKAALNAQGLSNGVFDVAVGSDASAFNTPRRQPFQWRNSSSNGRQAPIGMDGIVNDDRPRGSPRSGLSPGRIDYQV